MSGLADDLVSRMRSAGVRAIFGLPGGGGNLDVIDAAARAELPFVLTATETASAIAALAQAEVARAPGACITTLGPGAASVVNGVACAYLDRAPIVVVTDSHPAAGTAFEHQRLDHRALLASVSRWSGALSGDDVAGVLDAGFVRLASAPPGPVHFDWPGTEAPRAAVISGGSEVRPHFPFARKPLLIVGLAARRTEDAAAVRAFCEARGVPALVTYKAKGVVPDGHAWFGGIFTHGRIERDLIGQADLIIGVGFDPVEILPRPWDYPQPVISIAPWRMADDHVPFQSQHVGDIAGALGELSIHLPSSDWDMDDVRGAVESAKAAIDLPARRMTAQDTVRTAARLCAARSRVTVDAGAHMLAATMLWPVSEPNGLLISNGLSTMGFAVPAAIGAAVAERGRPIVAMTGDGGLLICLGELATIARERLNIVTIVFNDGSLSLIDIKQQARGLAPAGVALGDVHWTRIADGFGLPAWRATTVRELETAIGAAMEANGPSLIEARVDASNYSATLKAIRG